MDNKVGDCCRDGEKKRFQIYATGIGEPMHPRYLHRPNDEKMNIAYKKLKIANNIKHVF